MESDTLTAFVDQIASGRIRVVDLTFTLSPDFPVIVLPPEFGQATPMRIQKISRYDEAGPAWYWNNITVGEHTGTHFDAPIHWFTGRDLPNNAVDTLPVRDTIAPACVIDCSADAARDCDYLLTIPRVEAWEERHGRIPPRHWVLMRTDWSKKDWRSYANLREDGAHTPGPDSAVMRWLVEERAVLGFGTETIGTDAGQASHFDPPMPAHHFLHGAGRYGLQCLRNLDQLPPTGAVIVAAPLKIQNGSGSPLRVLALVSPSRPDAALSFVKPSSEARSSSLADRKPRPPGRRGRREP
jgi:kynurenine formamidase